MAGDRCPHLTTVPETFPESYPARCGECGMRFPDAESRLANQVYAAREAFAIGGDVGGE